MQIFVPGQTNSSLPAPGRQGSSPVRILIHGINFAPELVGVGKYTGEMAEWLAERGHDVRAVTAPPFNPEWKIASGFSPWWYSREDSMRQSQPRAGVRELVATAATGGSRDSTESGALPSNRPDLHREPTAGHLTAFRCPVWVPLRPSAAKRILHLASFALASFPVMLRQVPWKPDVVLVLEPTLFCVPAAVITGRFCGAKTWLHVQDFEADAGFELGLLKPVGLRLAVEWAEKKSMSVFDRVSTISGKMLAKLVQKGVAPSARRLFPNWVDTDAIFPLPQPSPLRAQLGISAREVVALYAGSMARKQGLEVLAEAACRLAAHEGLRFVFCGQGPGKAILASLTSQLVNVQWIPLQPFERLNDLLNLADIHLLPQKADAADLVMPSKLTGMLASGRPVVATCRPDTQLAHVVEGRGMVVEPGDASAFTGAIEQLAQSPRLREKLGGNARAYALSELEKENVLSRFERELLLCAAAG
jgi:colanic acid biosynthesis glycosyl transferase WcaI